MRRATVATAFVLFCVLPLLAACGGPSVIARHTAPDGDWDYVSIDADHGRAYVGRGDGVLALDLATGKVTPNFVRGRYTAAVVPLPGGKVALTTNRHDNLIGFFDRTTGKVIEEIATDAGPDAATLDPVTGTVYVMNNAAGTVSVVDSASRRIIRKIPVGGSIEAGGLDGQGHLFVNVEDRNSVAVVDLKKGKVTATIALQQCQEPTGIVVDPSQGLAFSACGNGRLNVIDTATLKVITTVPIGEGCDALMADAARKRLYASNGDGTLSILSIANGRAPEALATVPTTANGRTGAVDPATGRIYIAGGPYDAKEAKTIHFAIAVVDTGK